MSRSYKKYPFTKGRHASWKRDRKCSSRKYRRFVSRHIHNATFDDIHNKHKSFWNRWNWSPDYISYFGEYKNPTLRYGAWRLMYGDTEAEILNDHRQEYLKAMRK